MREAKRMKLTRCILTISFWSFIFASEVLAAETLNTQEAWTKANQLYREKQFEASASAYEEVLKAKPSAEGYYNLANAYFKAKKLGLAILNYERALLFNPRDRDVQFNLNYANRLIEYKVEDKRNWFVRKKSQWLKFVTFKEGWVVFLGCYGIFALGFLFSLVFRKRPVFGKLGSLAVSLLIFSSLPVLLKFGDSGWRHRGIVTENQVEVRYGPSPSDRIAFRLVEGLEVSVNDEREDWYRIQLHDGRGGWLQKSQVTLI